MAIITKKFKAEGTHCSACEKIIIRQAMKVHGVKDATFDLANEVGTVTFDDNKTTLTQIFEKIEEKNYSCSTIEGSDKGNSGMLFTLFTAASVIAIIYLLFQIYYYLPLPDLTQSMSLWLVFIVGLITGFHCVGMCGGFVVAYSSKAIKDNVNIHKAHFMYAFGKTLSYTLIGAAFGLLGSIIAFTPALRGWIAIIAGLFLVLFGLKTLNWIPALRKISFTPKFLSGFVAKHSAKNNSPIIVGLLNGLFIACGPLQAMYILAAGTGSWLLGAKIMLVFGLGTLPVLIGFGYATSFVSRAMIHKLLKFSGILVLVLGILMLNNGLALTGTGYDFKSIGAKTATFLNQGITVPSNNQAETQRDNIAVQKDGYQEINMLVDASGWTPDTFILKQGVPVKWNINAKVITGCNRAIQVPKYSLKFDLKQGLQTIEFTPTEEGIVPWSCWMGMIPGTFIVKNEADFSNPAAVKAAVASAPAPKAGGCGCGCGGSGGGGCGGATSGGAGTCGMK